MKLIPIYILLIGLLVSQVVTFNMMTIVSRVNEVQSERILELVTLIRKGRENDVLIVDSIKDIVYSIKYLAKNDLEILQLIKENRWAIVKLKEKDGNNN